MKHRIFTLNIEIGKLFEGKSSVTIEKEEKVAHIGGTYVSNREKASQKDQ